MIDNHRLDCLYTHPFRDGKGKYFTVVSSDDHGVPSVVEFEHPWPTRNKIKTRLTFIKGDDGGHIKQIELKRFKYYARKGDVETEEGITFSFPYFVGLISFLQSLAGLNLNDVNERRIQLMSGPGLDADTRKQFHTLAATPEGQELIREVVRNGQLSGSDIINIAYRKNQLEIFQGLMSGIDAIARYRTSHGIRKTGDEAVWQHFFEANTWIFGYGLNFVFNRPLEGRDLESVVRGHDITGAGKRADALLKTAGILSSLCLVEIKKPNTDLLEREAYRPDCWQVSRELSGGIAQSQKTVQRTLENLPVEFRPTDGNGNPTGEIVYSYRPKSFLLIGKLSEFMTDTGPNREKFASFELLRKNTIAPEIITFDELLERAKFIVSRS
ncbi:Shedu immune nuclease family protein [Bradyrhizobium sp. CCBAU 53415]|uniref:Shedu immune nuclease family protein n=1 Tax=Bradyrhizobium sp. CCBAU 53415 TaxID=1325119 RepID=UPI002306B1FB|nr:Shedu immune nuclease family protein [Bradyrhizobium sp. CCBAU 53415]